MTLTNRRSILNDVMKAKRGHKTKSHAVTKSKGKARPKKGRTKASVKNDRKRQGHGVQKARDRPAKRAKHVSKVDYKPKVSAKAKGRKRSGRGKAKATDAKTRIGIKHTDFRSKKQAQADFFFSKRQTLVRKQAIFNADKRVAKTIQTQLRRKGGKPPGGIVVIFTGKALVKVDGKLKKVDAQRAYVSDYTLVINEASIHRFIDAKLTLIRQDFTQWMKATSNGETLSEDDSKGIFLPDSISQISIKFIYPK